jgi:hypothetical protein
MKPSQRRPVFRFVPGPNGQPTKQFIGFQGDPGTMQRTPPQRRAAMGLAGFGGSNASEQGGRVPPLPNGEPGNPLYPYDEKAIWGTGGAGDQVTAPVDPSTGVFSDPGPQVFDPGISLPFGISIIPWRNPTTFQSVPILASTPITTPVLSLNMQRNGLVIQNNSTATSPDIPATFWIGFNAQPQIGNSLSLAPGAGLLFDIICPRDSIFILPAGAVGASAVTQGVVVQGTYAPI